MYQYLKKNHAVLGWVICGIAAAFYCYEYLLRVTPSVMEMELRGHFNLNAYYFGALASSYYAAYTPMQLPVGMMMDRYGPRKLLTFACLICVIGTFMFAGTNLYWFAYIGRFLVGFGSAFAFVGVLKLATIWLPEDKMGMAAGMTSALGALGAMFADNIMHVFVHDWGWQKTVNATGILGIIMIFIIWYGIHDAKDDKQHETSEGTIASNSTLWRDLKIILLNKQIWVVGFYGSLVYLPTTVIAELWGIPYLVHAHYMTQADAGLANSLIFLGFIVGAPLMGLISDKIKRRKPPMVLGALLASLTMLVILYFPHIGKQFIFVLMFVLGLFYSAQCLVFPVARELSPNEASGTAMAFTNMLVMLIGTNILQPGVGWLLEYSLSRHTPENVIDIAERANNIAKLYTAADYTFALSVVPIGIILAAILAFFLKETYANTRD